MHTQTADSMQTCNQVCKGLHKFAENLQACAYFRKFLHTDQSQRNKPFVEFAHTLDKSAQTCCRLTFFLRVSGLFEFSVQCNVVQNSLSDDQIILPSFRKRFSIDSHRLEHQSRVTYLRIINEPADSKETMIKVINFLYNIYEVQRTISHLLVVGDAKTFEVLRKLKDEYGSDLDWLIPFPGDWHILKKLPASCFQIVWPCRSAFYCTKSWCQGRHIEVAF